MKTRMATFERDRISAVMLAIAVLLVLVGCKRAPVPGQASAAPRQETMNRRILVVHSYHPGYQWVAAINRGITMIVPPGKVDLEFFYMDMKRHPDAAWREHITASVLTAIAEWNPDVVITVDDAAQACVGKILAAQTRPAVVFCGVNRSIEEYGYEKGNVTGVLERPHFRESIDLFNQIMPEARRILVLSDAGLTSEGAFSAMRQEAEEMTAVQAVDWCMAATFEEWKQCVERGQEQADALAVYTYHTLLEREGSNRMVPPDKVMEWTAEHSSIPVIGFLVFAVDDGALCGVLESGVEQGSLTARMAMKILQGRSAASIPVETGLHGQRMVNLNVAEKLGIPIHPSLLNNLDVIIQYERIDDQ